jgi:NAD(P)-dependent dehydrogenase (short-subunit alcohol dehydrogenase family)
MIGNMAMSGKRNFLITGAGSGLGRALASAALSSGYSVIGTVRSEAARQEFGAMDSARARAIVLDVTDFAAIGPAVVRAERDVGPIDVLVNSAGYGHEGTLEESPLEEMRRQFDVNVFGAVAMIKAVLPFMRERRRGHIVNITSMAGYVGLAGIPYYASSKFALEGISEVLANEVRGFGIKVTAIAPGSFRTDWAGRSMVRSPRSIPDYDLLFDPVRQARAEKSGRQSGDPARAARALLSVVEAQDPPVHLLLGTDCLKLVREKLESLEQEIDAWESTTRSTEYAQGTKRMTI